MALYLATVFTACFAALVAIYFSGGPGLLYQLLQLLAQFVLDLHRKRIIIVVLASISALYGGQVVLGVYLESIITISLFCIIAYDANTSYLWFVAYIAIMAAAVFFNVLAAYFNAVPAVLNAAPSSVNVIPSGAIPSVEQVAAAGVTIHGTNPSETERKAIMNMIINCNNHHQKMLDKIASPFHLFITRHYDLGLAVVRLFFLVVAVIFVLVFVLVLFCLFFTSSGGKIMDLIIQAIKQKYGLGIVPNEDI